MKQVGKVCGDLWGQLTILKTIRGNCLLHYKGSGVTFFLSYFLDTLASYSIEENPSFTVPNQKEKKTPNETLVF